MPRPNRQLELKQSYTATDDPSTFEQKVRSVADRVGSSEEVLSRGYLPEIDQFDTEEVLTLTVDGFPDRGVKQTFDIIIERAESQDRTLFRVKVSWFGVNHEDINEMEERGVDIMQKVHNALRENFDVQSPKGSDFYVPSNN